MQIHLFKSLEDEFQEEINNLSVYGTPETLHFKLRNAMKMLKIDAYSAESNLDTNLE